MKYFIHPVNIPRKLASRYKRPVVDSTKAWDNFRGKLEVQDCLIPVQKHLCSYCETELVRGNGGIGYHIEHIEPKSMNLSRTFDFSNLLISCFDSGYEVLPSVFDPQPISCGHAKKDEFNPLFFIKPTDQGCEGYFFYELDGRVVPNPELNDLNEIDRANYTIDILNLNCRRLLRERSDMILKGLNIVNDLLDNKKALSDFAELELTEINDKNQSYVTTRRQYFNDFIGSM